MGNVPGLDKTDINLNCKKQMDQKKFFLDAARRKNALLE
jgi:hypothetical protein